MVTSWGCPAAHVFEVAGFPVENAFVDVFQYSMGYAELVSNAAVKPLGILM
jgi:hypothetical protein